MFLIHTPVLTWVVQIDRNAKFPQTPVNKKRPHSQEVETVGRAFLCLGGFEEDSLGPACHSKSSMVVKIMDCSRKIYVVSRKN